MSFIIYLQMKKRSRKKDAVPFHVVYHLNVYANSIFGKIWHLKTFQMSALKKNKAHLKSDISDKVLKYQSILS